MIKKLELLAPAKDLECGTAAINCGADALYIGAPKYGARSSAGNSLNDIETLIKYAHKYYARVYVTVNTLVYEEELEEVRALIHKLYDIGTDAIIIQDMGILKMDIPPVAIFASTQTNNFNKDKIAFLESCGIKRVILARELSLDQIKTIRENTKLELEAFVHGALCVSLSGQCYLSYYSSGRSANRGECSQPCRHTYSLLDSEGRTIVKDKYLLSLKDLNLSDDLPALIDAGITSFKIEGRLKDIVYVKNVTSYYRRRLDEIINLNGEFSKASSGTVTSNFTPDLQKSFNRGFTRYFLYGKQKSISSFNYQKSLGKLAGKIESVTEKYFTLKDGEKPENGDGICFFDKKGALDGMNILKTEGNKIFVRDTKGLFAGAEIFRNRDNAFYREVSNSSERRGIAVELTAEQAGEVLRICARDEDNNLIKSDFFLEKIPAENREQALETFARQMRKSGASIFDVKSVKLNIADPFFIPVSTLNEMRRQVLSKLEEKRIENYLRICPAEKSSNARYISDNLDYRGNVVNQKAAEFYREHGVREIETGMEKNKGIDKPALMICRYCIKKELNLCPKDKKERNYPGVKEPLYLKDQKKTYLLEFRCNECFMVIKPE